ncbi:uncharacterized protein Z518_01639 [Rhinocladiella mackenziei CBS 650.93]|uniref:Rhinocladiella mackenziei CBS 650.93 unplaced genomic scaffold supercont1.1, whole genome shotgun sequence n=1 Tax=Rhinocladiella mackenziei CBS 650.93 TaxID=1442369 RepID=A0A0D2JM85_9EURO|nr:uncharacterized protein Z518_01639 [Rhinocladiella mackenziei CBS 650.93]KIX10555.1 hypothetical protein Z518_01639 [Rhinocladiella mackenziei CBS 650.93]
MNIPKFHDREKALEDEYIRRKEAEKFKPATTTQTGTESQSGTGNVAQNTDPKQ